MIKHEEVRDILKRNEKSLSNKNICYYFTKEEFTKLQQYINEQEKKDEIIDGVKEILALNYSYQEIGIKISRLFKRIEEEMK